MPVYEYECTQCEKIFEIQQRMADDPIAVCPECGGSIKKIISRSSFQLKGGGWYSDGYSGCGSGSNGSGSSGSKSTDKPAPSCSAAGACPNCPATS